MPEIVQEIGAYAGLAAVVGLAVLSALYFSQARDVKRLREWAGRAPERTAEGIAAPQVAQRVVAQPQQRPAAAQPTTPPALPGKPAPAQAAAAGATPATAKAGTPASGKPAAATPAAQKADPGAPVPANAGGGKAADAPGVPVPAGTGDKQDEAKPPVPVTAGAPAEAEAEHGTGEPGTPAPAGPTAQGGTAAPPRPGEPARPKGPTQPSGPPAQAPPGGTPPARGQGLPSTPAARRLPTDPAATPGAKAGGAGAGRAPRFPSRRPAPAPSETAILPPSSRPEMPWHQRLLASPRYLVLAVVGVLVIGGGAAFGLSELGKEEAPPPKTEQAEDRFAPDSDKKTPSAPAIDPADVTVSVLNGTTVPGLAAQIGDKVESFGFQLGNVTNNSDQTRNESVVLFAPGGEREAAVVGKKLGIGQREPIDTQSQALGGDARVVVITGADQTQ